MPRHTRISTKAKRSLALDRAQGAWPVLHSIRSCAVGYENHKPYFRTPYLNPYQIFSALLGRNEKIESYNYWCHVKTLYIINIRYEYEISKLHIYAPPQKVAGYYVIPSELLSVCPSVRPSAVEHSCPVHNFDTV